MDQYGYYWTYPERQIYYTPLPADEGAIYFEPLTSDDSRTPNGHSNDPTLILMEYFSSFMSPHNAHTFDKTLPQLISLIEICDPNRPLFHNPGNKINDLSSRRTPRSKGAPNITLFMIFMHLFVNYNILFAKFGVSGGYDLLTAFVGRGPKWSLDMCTSIRRLERDLRHSVLENKTNPFKGLPQAEYDRYIPLFTLTGDRCKQLGVHTILSNPIFRQYLYSSGGPIERAWHPHTGAAFTKYISQLTFNDTGAAKRPRSE